MSADWPATPNDSAEAEGACSTEGPDRDHPSPAEELSPLHEGEPQARQQERCADDEG